MRQTQLVKDNDYHGKDPLPFFRVSLTFHLEEINEKINEHCVHGHMQ